MVFALRHKPRLKRGKFQFVPSSYPDELSFDWAWEMHKDILGQGGLQIGNLLEGGQVTPSYNLQIECINKIG